MTTDKRLRVLYARLQRENRLLLTLLERGASRQEALRRLESGARSDARRDGRPPGDAGRGDDVARPRG